MQTIFTTTLGSGSFARVFTIDTLTTHVAVKQVLDAAGSHELRKEYDSLKAVTEACTENGGEHDGIRFTFPTPFEYFPSLETLLRRAAQPVADESAPLRPCYLMSKLYPVTARRRRFVHEHLIDQTVRGTVSTDDVRLCRLYLGDVNRTGPAAAVAFDGGDVALSLFVCAEMGLYVTVIAYAMGRVLAELHWKAMVDGRGIKFIMGGGRLNSLLEDGLFCFGVRHFTAHNNDVHQLVGAFHSSHPAYPANPAKLRLSGYTLEQRELLVDVWREFLSGYRTTVAGMSSLQPADKITAQSFVDGIQSTQQQRTFGQISEPSGCCK